MSMSSANVWIGLSIANELISNAVNRLLKKCFMVFILVGENVAAILN